MRGLKNDLFNLFLDSLLNLVCKSDGNIVVVILTTSSSAYL